MTSKLMFIHPNLHYIISHIHIILLILFSLLVLPNLTLAQGGGQWQLLQRSIGISAMHMQLLHNDRVIIFDRTDFGPSNLSLPKGHCRHNPNDQALQTDCTAHSVEYDSLTNTFRPLFVQTDVWCSSGTTLSDGRLLQTGGYNDGERVVRIIQACSTCDWQEFPQQLLQRRWYATNHILPDGRTIIIGGRMAFNYEFFPKTTPALSRRFNFPFLVETNDPQSENNLYPFVFLHVDGNLFIFANNRAILFDYNNNKVVRTYPSIPGGDPRCYPSTGSAVLLPLMNSELGMMMEPEVLICGGAPTGSFLLSLTQAQFVKALNTCARMKISDPNPNWVIETMPMSRTMSDMIVLPNGDVIIINGAESGTAGWDLGRDPVLVPVIYHPDRALGLRFEVMNPTTIPRMYHSSAILLRDGRVLVGGSNPHQFYNFTNVLFPTELSLEAFSPPYLDPSNSNIRPTILLPVPKTKINSGAIISVKFSISGKINPSLIKVTIIRPPFSTHSFSQSQRLIVLTKTTPVTPAGPREFEVMVKAPGSRNIAPEGFYMLYVVHQHIPSTGVWVQLS